MDAFEEQFMSSEDGLSRLAFNDPTPTIEMALWRQTVNAPDWSVSPLLAAPAMGSSADQRRETAYAAQMARELLWESEDDLKLVDFVDVSQTCVSLHPSAWSMVPHATDRLVRFSRPSRNNGGIWNLGADQIVWSISSILPRTRASLR